MSPDFEKAPRRNQAREQITIGDIENHDAAAVFEPSKTGCLSWHIAELAVGIGGTVLLNSQLPEGDHVIQHGWALLGIWGTIPATYAFGVISWINHLETYHYMYTRDHEHTATKALKAPIYAVRFLNNWINRKLDR